ncbi:hypothetical protein Tco_0728235 [Tanacetum coccineum]|uniref:Reverse transcriptase domain-containing protein n=1 Tax=Tanacetum coccineum TaxID=301880 RepID=A0ABQ4YKL0_9ASTR
MRTRSQARKRRQPQVRQTSVESSNLEKPDNPPIVTMADNRTMAQCSSPPTEGYEDAIVIPEITTNNFEIKHGLLNLVKNKQFFGNDKEDPHAHIRYFNKITSTMKIRTYQIVGLNLLLSLFPRRGSRIWLEKEPPRSIENMAASANSTRELWVIRTSDGLISNLTPGFHPSQNPHAMSKTISIEEKNSINRETNLTKTFVCSKKGLKEQDSFPKPPEIVQRPSDTPSIHDKPTLFNLLKSHPLMNLLSTITCNLGKGAHYGYNCPPRVPIISNPEPCKNQTIDEPLQNLQSLQQQCLLGTCQKCGCNKYNGVCFYCTIGNGTPSNFSTPYFSNDSPSVENHPPQPQYVPYSCEIRGNDSHYGYDCQPQVPFVYNQDLCFNQNFDYFPQTSPSFPQQYPCCENCGGPHETYQCQPMNEDYYHEQNSCYDSNSFGFDQVQPPQYTVNHPIFNSQNDLLNSQNKLMEQMTTLCDLVGQAIQKKEEEKRMAEEQAAKDRYWKIPICYDDDEDDTIAITPVLPIEEPDNSLNDSPYGEDIDYVDASPPDVEIVSLEVVEIVDPEVGRIDDDILLTIKDDILREKIVECQSSYAKIVSLRDNPTHLPKLWNQV